MMRPLSLVLTLGLASACGGAALPSRFQAPVAPTEQAVAEHLARPRARSERSVVVGLTVKPSRLCAWDLNGTALFKVPVEARSQPLVAGDAVVMAEAEGIVVRDLASGAVRLTIADEGRLIAADGIGSELVVALADEEDPATGEIVFVRGQRVAWRRPLSQAVGTPALVGEQVLVPWGHQRLSVLASADGVELSRWDFDGIALAQATVDRDHVYVGQYGLLRVSGDLPGLRHGTVEAYSPVKRTLPGQPPLLRDGYAVVVEPGHASERVAVTFRPSASEVAAAEQDLLLSRFYRVLIGMHASRDELRFVRSFEHDLVAASIEDGYSLVVDAAGGLYGVDAAGSELFKRELGEALQSAALRIGKDAAPQAQVTTGNDAAKGAKGSAETLHAQLLGVARLTDDRLGLVRMFALDRLAAHDDASITAELIQLCADRATTESVRNTACEHLSHREKGGGEVVEALRRRASFLDGTPQPPVAALSRASTRMQLKQAAPYLLSHAEDPNTSAADLVFVFEALDALGHKPAIAMLERFVRLHHAEPAGSELSKPLFAALGALGNLRAKNTRQTLEAIASDALTLEPVRQKAREALSVIDAPPRVDAPVAKPEPAPVVKAEEPEPEEVQTDPRPWSVDGDSVKLAFKAARPQLLRCLRDDPAGLKSARVSLVLTGQGEVEGSFVTPTSMQPCMEPILRSLRFPSTRIGRQHVTHTLQLDADKAKLVEKMPAQAKAKPR